MRPLRVVIDTNLYIMARLSPGGHIATWLQAAPSSPAYHIYTSSQIMAELEEKLIEKFSMDPVEVKDYMTDLQSGLTVVSPTVKIDAVPNDPDDKVILECAVEAQADLIVSADKHLYKLKRYKTIGIMHPNDLKYMFPEAFGESHE
jgi:putative PIN family toxin of toxin-antitoxin system